MQGLAGFKFNLRIFVALLIHHQQSTDRHGAEAGSSVETNILCGNLAAISRIQFDTEVDTWTGLFCSSAIGEEWMCGSVLLQVEDGELWLVGKVDEGNLREVRSWRMLSPFR